jgi:hypothetical protein
MNAMTEVPTILMTIKGSAMNKARCRIWVERDLSELAAYGFTADMRCDLTYIDGEGLLITFNPAGKKKPTVRKGSRTKVIFDCCMSVEQRDLMFNGAERLTVWASANQLMVTI